MVPRCILAEKFSDSSHLLFLFWRSCQSPELADIAVVHSDNDIKALEVVGHHLTAVMGKFIAATACMHAHPLVGKFAGMLG